MPRKHTHTTARRAPTRARAIRDGVVGLGHIAQVAVLPAFAHARRNSVLAALVSDDPTKRRVLSRKYRVPSYSYDEYEDCLEQLDAVYQDVRIVQALYESAETGNVVQVPHFRPPKRPGGTQRITRPGIRKPDLINVESAST